MRRPLGGARRDSPPGRWRGSHCHLVRIPVNVLRTPHAPQVRMHQHRAATSTTPGPAPRVREPARAHRSRISRCRTTSSSGARGRHRQDRPLLRGHQTEPGDDAAILHRFPEPGRRRQLEVVAEGVELEAQRDLLRDEHCGLARGFLFARPLEDVARDALGRTLGRPCEGNPRPCGCVQVPCRPRSALWHWQLLSRRFWGRAHHQRTRDRRRRRRPLRTAR